MNDKQQLMALGEEMAEHAMASPTWVWFELDRYDAGSLNDFGGGYIDWWWDYLRTELDRAFDFYQGQIDALMGAADARRIAACLSACEGFGTAYLERAQFDSGYLPEAEHATTIRQRDELLAALEALVKIIADTPRPDPDDVFATIDEARGVINKVRGEVCYR